MAHASEAILKSALALSESERSDLVGRLLESLEPPMKAGVEEAWRQEVKARVAALDAGEVETVAWSDVRDRLFEKLNGRRGT